MKARKLLGALAIACMAVSCSDNLEKDQIDGGNVINPEDNVYISVSVQLPTGGPFTRSQTTDPDGNNSSTSSDKTEVGKGYENKVNKMLIVLARKFDNGYITSGMVDNGLETVEGTQTVHATAKFSKTSLAGYYGSDNRLEAALDQDVNVFVVCNYTDELIEYFKFDKNGIAGIGKFDSGWIDQICKVTEDNGDNTYGEVPVWKKEDMLMTNATIAPKKLPLNLKDWDGYTSAGKAFDLSGTNATLTGEIIANDGPIRVERSVARFDFKDGSDLGGNRYHAVFTKNEDGSITSYVDIVLNRMALVNMSNKFYYFRRVVNKDGTNPQVGWPELSWLSGKEGNYVKDVDYESKRPGEEMFNFPLFDTGDNKTVNETARNQWYTSKISDVLASKETDEYTGNGNNKSYKIWRYVTENTVNGPEKMVNGLSTGIIFKGKMEPTDYIKSPTGGNEATNKELKKLAYVLGYGRGDCSLESLGLAAEDIASIKLNNNTNTDPILYTFNGMLYLRWPSIRAAAIADAKIAEESEQYDYSRTFYQNIFGTGHHNDSGDVSGDQKSPDYLWHEWQKSPDDAAKLKAFKEAVTRNGITIYQSSNDGDDWGYYCYYYYWNQHNNNDNPGVMGEMEFAVVRNNVYKLAVTKIEKLGHPRLSENDPDPVDPDDPDEKGDVYITVSVKVLPWVVRVNNIEF